MDVGIRSPFLDFFRRGEVAKDVRMLAARGALAPRAHEQIALLAMLTEDADSEIRGTAEATLAQIPNSSLAGFLGRSDVPDALRDFFRGRGVEPDLTAVGVSDDPLIDASAGDPAPAPPGADGEAGGEDAERSGAAQRLGQLNVSDKMKHAMKGTKEERAILVRDPNKLVSVAVLSSPKLTESEVEQFAKMANVSEEVLRIIGPEPRVDQELRRHRRAHQEPEDAAGRLDEVRPAAERARSEDDRARSQSAGAAEAAREEAAARRRSVRTPLPMLSSDQKLGDQAPLLSDHAPHHQAGFREGDRSGEVDDQRRRARARRRVHGRAVADAIGLGENGNVGGKEVEGDRAKVTGNLGN